MDPASITKDFLGLQKQSLNNLFDTMVILHDQAENTGRLWSKQLGFNEQAQEIADRWRAVFNRCLKCEKRVHYVASLEAAPGCPFSNAEKAAFLPLTGLNRSFFS